jgi:hypothetical protein
VLPSAQTHATGLSKMNASMRHDFKNRLTPDRVNKFLYHQIEAGQN